MVLVRLENHRPESTTPTFTGQVATGFHTAPPPAAEATRPRGVPARRCFSDGTGVGLLKKPTVGRVAGTP